MSDYRLTATDIIVRAADNAFIPNDPANVDRQQYEAWLAAGGVPDPCVPTPSVSESVLPQDLMAQFTADDAAKIQTSIAGNAQFWLLWQALTAQRDPMEVRNARFREGWQALTGILGPSRMDAIAAALGITP